MSFDLSSGAKASRREGLHAVLHELLVLSPVCLIIVPELLFRRAGVVAAGECEGRVDGKVVAINAVHDCRVTSDPEHIIRD